MTATTRRYVPIKNVPWVPYSAADCYRFAYCSGWLNAPGQVRNLARHDGSSATWQQGSILGLTALRSPLRMLSQHGLRPNGTFVPIGKIRLSSGMLPEVLNMRWPERLTRSQTIRTKRTPRRAGWRQRSDSCEAIGQGGRRTTLEVRGR